MPTFYRSYPLLESKFRDFVSKIDESLNHDDNGAWQKNFKNIEEVKTGVQVRFTLPPKVPYSTVQSDYITILTAVPCDVIAVTSFAPP